MIKIKQTNPKYSIDYKLENGELLYAMDWNGENYTIKEGGREVIYKPVYRWQAEDIDLQNLDENSDEWWEAVEIIGFEKW